VFFLGNCPFNAKSGATDQLRLVDRPVDRDRRIGHPCSGVFTAHWRKI